MTRLTFGFPLILSLAAWTVCAPLAGAQQPSHASSTVGTTIDPRAMAVMAKVEKSMIGLKTYQAECYTTFFYPARQGRPFHERREVARLLAAKPTKKRYDQWNVDHDAVTGRWVKNTKRFGITFVCDGRTDWEQFGPRYRTNDRVRANEMSTNLEPWDGFYAASTSPHGELAYAQKAGELLELRAAGTELVDGILCDKVFAHRLTSYMGNSQEYWETWYMSRDGLVRRKVERVEFGGMPGFTKVAAIRNIRLDKPIAASVFTYKPPKGVLSKAENERLHPTPVLLTNGKAAPDLSALDSQNKPVRLSDFKGKVVVLDFWASWCGPCVESMPHNQAVAKKLQAEGLPVVLLATDNSEERGAFSTWVKANSTKLSALTFVHIPPQNDVSGKLFHVSGIPTQYVVDKNGIVRASFVGYGGPSGDLEKAVRAALTAGG